MTKKAQSKPKPVEAVVEPVVQEEAVVEPTKSYARNEVVLTATGKDLPTLKITPASFGKIDFKGYAVKGESYYVEKAVKAGATKAK